jgi:hypothetical protein
MYTNRLAFIMTNCGLSGVRSEFLYLNITRPVGRPKHRWDDDVRNDLRKMKLLKWMEQTQNRQVWKKVVEKAKTLQEL